MQGGLQTVSLVILWLASFYLLGLGLASLFARSQALAFLTAFAQTPRANWIECLLRALVGGAFIIVAPRFEYQLLVQILGVFLMGTALAMILAPRLHRLFAASAVASVAPFLPLIGIASIGLAVLLGLALAAI